VHCVGIGEAENVAMRFTGASRARPRLSEPTRRQIRRGNDANARVLGSNGSHDCRGIVGRVVVDDDDFDLGMRGAEHRSKTSLDIAGFVACWDDDGDEGLIA
jgi:hypothetical protein